MALLSSTVCFAATPRAHLRAVESLLLRQGFTSAMDSGAQLTKVGEIREPAAAYEIYYYLHVNQHPVGPSVHAIRRVVVLRDDREYLGAYLVDEPPYRVVGDDVLFRDDQGHVGKLHVGPRGPPQRAVVLGELFELNK